MNNNMLYHKLVDITTFLGDQMTDEQAERIGDLARDLSEADLYNLDSYASGILYTILRQIAAEKGWM